MTNVSKRAGDTEILPRYVFLEPLIARSRVLEIDAVSLTGGHSARFLKDRGATQVIALDSDGPAISQAQSDAEVAVEGVAFRAGDYVGLETGTYDLVVLHRCARLVSEPKRIEVLKSKLARLGRLVLVLRHDEGVAVEDLLASGSQQSDPDYGELVKLLQTNFSSVEIALQTAFVGYSVTPAGVDEPTTALDESLTDDSTPAYYLFICGARPAKLDTAALTTLPSTVVRELASVAGRAPAAAPAPKAPAAPATPFSLLDDLDSELQNQRVRELEQRTQAALDEVQKAELTAAQAMAERDQLRARLKNLQATPPPAPGPDPAALAEIAALKEAAEVARSEAERRERALHQVSEQLESLTNAAEGLRRGLALNEGELESARAEVTRLSAEVGAKEKALAEAVEAERVVRAEVARLEFEAGEQEKTLGGAVEAEKAARAEASRLESELSAKEKALADAVEAEKAARAEVSRLESELAAKEKALADAARLQEQVTLLGSELEEQASAAERLEASLTAAKAELANNAAQLGEQEQLARRAQQRVSTLEAELKAARQEAERQTGTFSEREKAFEQLSEGVKSRMEQELAARTQAEEAAADQKKRVDELQAQVTRLESEVGLARRGAEEAELRVAAAVQAAGNLQAERETLKRALAERDVAFLELQNQLASARRAAQEAEQKAAASRQPSVELDLEALGRSVEEREAAVTEARRQAQEAERRAQEAEQKVQAAEQRIQAAELRADVAAEKVSASSAELDAIRVKLEEREGQLERVVMELKTLRAERADKTAVTELEERVQQAEEALARKSEEVEVRARALDEMREQVTALGRELADARTELHRLGNDLQEQVARSDVEAMHSKEREAEIERAVAAARAQAEETAFAEVQKLSNELHAREAEVVRLTRKLAERDTSSGPDAQALDEAEDVASKLREELAAKSAEVEQLQEALKAAASPVVEPRSEESIRSDAATLAKELELTRSEADQLLSFLIERQADVEREASARAQAERRVQELTAEVTALRATAQGEVQPADHEQTAKAPAPRD